MSNPLEEVHWHEGLFLRPHHFQVLQRGLAGRLAWERKMAWPYPYGLAELALSRDALENHVVQIDRLRAITPGGTVVSHPGNADISPLDIRAAFESGRNFTVFLGVPRWFPDRANTLDLDPGVDRRIKRLYRVEENALPDENSGENQQPVLMRRLNVRLTIEGEDPSDLELLPLARIVRAAGEKVGLPREDVNFMPPCLVVQGSVAMRELLRDLANQVEASRKELSVQLARANVTFENVRGPQFEQLLRLRTLCRFGARLTAKVAAPVWSPFDAYVELRELLAELSSLYPDRDLYQSPGYDHDRPALVFQDLATRIRTLLRGAVTAQFLHVEFVREADGLSAKLAAEHLSRPREYYLGIRTRMEIKELVALVENPDRFKVMPRSLANSAVLGVKLELERMPSFDLPAESGLFYFRLLTGERPNIWRRITEEMSVSLRWLGWQNSDFKVGLYMPVPPVEEKA